MPPYIANYAINQTVACKRGLKKYGFHGLSCKCHDVRPPGVTWASKPRSRMLIMIALCALLLPQTRSFSAQCRGS